METQATFERFPQTAAAQAAPNEHERHWAALAHLGALLLALLTGWMAGVAGVIAAAAVYLLQASKSDFVADHARESINFNLSMFLYACTAALLGALLVGTTVLTLGIGAIVTLPAGLLLLLAAGVIAVMWLVCSIRASVRAWHGERYRYPLTLRLFR